MSTCNQPVGLANTRISTDYDAQKSPGSLVAIDAMLDINNIRYVVLDQRGINPHTTTRSNVLSIWITSSHSCRYHVRA